MKLSKNLYICLVLACATTLILAEGTQDNTPPESEQTSTHSEKQEKHVTEDVKASDAAAPDAQQEVETVAPSSENTQKQDVNSVNNDVHNSEEPGVDSSENTADFSANQEVPSPEGHRGVGEDSPLEFQEESPPSVKQTNEELPPQDDIPGLEPSQNMQTEVEEPQQSEQPSVPESEPEERFVDPESSPEEAGNEPAEEGEDNELSPDTSEPQSVAQELWPEEETSGKSGVGIKDPDKPNPNNPLYDDTNTLRPKTNYRQQFLDEVPDPTSFHTLRQESIKKIIRRKNGDARETVILHKADQDGLVRVQMFKQSAEGEGPSHTQYREYHEFLGEDGNVDNVRIPSFEEAFPDDLNDNVGVEGDLTADDSSVRHYATGQMEDPTGGATSTEEEPTEPEIPLTEEQQKGKDLSRVVSRTLTACLLDRQF